MGSTHSRDVLLIGSCNESVDDQIYTKLKLYNFACKLKDKDHCMINFILPNGVEQQQQHTFQKLRVNKRKIQAVVLIVDCRASREQLRSVELVEHDLREFKEKPILIYLANEHSSAKNHRQLVTLEASEYVLQLSNRFTRAIVEPCCQVTGQGLFEGLDNLCSQLNINKCSVC